MSATPSCGRPSPRRARGALGPGGLARTAGLALCASLLGCHGGGPKRPRSAEAVPVQVASAQVQTVPLSVRAVGNVQAYATVAVRPQVTGQLEAVHFTEGQEVKKGDLLFSLDARPFRAALAQAKAALTRDTVQADNAAADAKRYAGLVTKGYVTQQQFDAARAAAAAAAATVTADKAQVEVAQLNLAYCTIRSPIAGRTGSALVQAGNLVQAAGADPLVVIAQLQPIYVSFSVPERELPRIRAHAGDALRVSVRPSGEQAEPRPESIDLARADAQGTLTFIDNAVNPSTGTIMLKARFDNADEALWPGEFVDTQLAIGQRAGAVVIPSEAIENGQNGTYVYVVPTNHKVEVRSVTVGTTDAHQAVIEKGLAAGEVVVTDGQLRLNAGTQVTIKSPEKAAAP